MAFDLKAVALGISDTQFAGQVMHFPSVGSTNTLALQAAQAGARSGVWVADEQTAGRGRGGHAWHSVAGEGLYTSVLIAPRLPMTAALLVSLAAGLAAKRAIAEVTGLDADIRWPNDLLVKKKKCAGILVETAVNPAITPAAEALLRYAVIGVGINLNHSGFPAEIATLATSLRIEAGRAISREAILIALLRSLQDELSLLADNRSADNLTQILDRFRQASSWVSGKRVRVEENGGYTGVTAGLDGSGFLLVDSDDGTRRTVLSGGVRDR